MHKLLVYIAFLFISLPALAQEKVLLLESKITMHKFRFYVGDVVAVKTKTEISHYKGVITNIADSSIMLNGKFIFKLKDITRIKNIEKQQLLQILSKASLIAGIAYPTVDVFNRVANHDYPIPVSTAYIGGSLIGASFLIDFLVNRRYSIGFTRRLRVIDVSVEPLKN